MSFEKPNFEVHKDLFSTLRVCNLNPGIFGVHRWSLRQFLERWSCRRCCFSKQWDNHDCTFFSLDKTMKKSKSNPKKKSSSPFFLFFFVSLGVGEILSWWDGMFPFHNGKLIFLEPYNLPKTMFVQGGPLLVITGAITPINGVITLLTTGRGPPCSKSLSMPLLVSHHPLVIFSKIVRFGFRHLDRFVRVRIFFPRVQQRGLRWEHLWSIACTVLTQWHQQVFTRQGGAIQVKMDEDGSATSQNQRPPFPPWN